MKSNFEKDLNNKVLLCNYLDKIYPKLFDGFVIEEVLNSNQQY